MESLQRIIRGQYANTLDRLEKKDVNLLTPSLKVISFLSKQ